MEDDRNLLSLPPYLCLAFIHGKDNELLTFCPIEENRGGVVEKSTPDLLLNGDYTIWNCCHGWLILSDADHYYLWSPAETIHLPPLPLNSEQEISYCLLTSPPGNSDSMVVLFETTEHSFFYCKVGDQQWTEQLISPEEEENPVMLDGRILFCNNRIQEQGVGTIDIKPDRLAFSFFGLEPLCLDVPWERIKQYLVESCGEIFSISMLLNGQCEWKEVFAIHVYKLDSSRKEWERVQSFKDRAFFLRPNSWFSCPATQTGIKGNHVYFQLYNDPTLYVYNMEDGTVSFSMPCPNLSEWCRSFWVIPNLGRVSKDAGGEIKSDSGDAGDEIKSKNREIVKHCTIEQVDFDKLPLEILTEIGSYLGWQDYMRFRAVNTTFRLAAPIQRSRNDICLPWLISWRQGDSIWDFVDPLHEGRYFITPNKELEDITALTCYSKRDWCVMFHGKDSIFLWNPFSRKTIPLPNLYIPDVKDDFFNCGTCSVAGCYFSSSPDSSESDCTIVVLFSFYVVYRINFINLGSKEWKSYLFRPGEHISLYKDNPLVFYNGAAYFLDEKGNLGIYREVGDEERDHAACGDETEDEDGEGEGHGDEIGDGDGDEEAEGYGDETGDEDGDEEEEGCGDETGDEDGDEEEEGHGDETEDDEAEGDGDEIGDEYGDEDEDHEVLDDVVLSPCESFHQKFLLECDGKLLSIFVGFLGEWVQIFSLDENDNDWVEVEDLGNHTIFISRFSAFSIVAPPRLQNRIYFPRFYGKNSVVYYSLESKQLHAHGMDDVFFEDFHDTKEQLLCGWITPPFLFMD